MKNSTFEQQSAARSRFALTLTPVAAACMLFASAGAQAQTAAAPAATANGSTQTVTVTGIRRAIESAIAVKKDSTSIVEAISAEDIGKLPDVSIAESLARLPGLSAQRVNGQAQSISIRGTAGDLATTLLNGREQVSTSADRTVEYDQYPSELINAVTVYKTPDAALVGQGLSGTVDLQSIKPLSLRERAVTFNLRGEKNSLGKQADKSKDTGYRFSASYVDQFADRTIGIALGFARQDKPNQSFQFETYDWFDNTINGQTLKAPKGIKGIVYAGKQVRDGYMGVLEFRPNRSFTSVVDVYHSKFNFDETRRGMEITFEPWANPTFTNTRIANGQLLGATVGNVAPIVRNNLQTRDDKLTSIGWNNKWTTGHWTVVADLSHSTADHAETLTELNASRAPETVTFNYTGGAIPTMVFGANYADPAAVRIGSNYGEGYYNAPSLTDKIDSFRLSGKYDLEGSMFSSVEFGFNSSKRSKEKQHLETGFSRIGNGTFSSAVLNAPTSLGMVGLPTVLAWDVPATLAANFSPFTPAVLVPWGATKNWSIDEKVYTYYGKLNIDTNWGNMPVRGNVGLQVVRTDQSSTANTLRAWPFADLVPLTDGKTYTDVLPNVNLAFGLSDQQTLRVGVSKSLARAKLDQLNAALEVGLTQQSSGNPFANGGNAKLEPWRSNNFDVSYEKYFGTKAYFAAAAFYKDLESYIYQITVPRDFTEYHLTGANTNIGPSNQPQNGEGGSIRGLEFSVSTPLDVLTPMLDGFGVTANASFTDSAITVKDQRFGSAAIPLPGLSKRVFNVTAYYEKNGFSARVSNRYRSDFVADIGGIGGAKEMTFIKADNVTDLQLGYEFQTGAAKGLSLIFQVNNLTNEAFETYVVSKDRPRGYSKYGRQMLFGINYKM